MTEPIVLATIFINGILYTLRHGNLVIRFDDFLGTFDDPHQNAAASIVIKILAIVLDVVASCNFGIEWDDNKSSPNTIIGCRDTRQMVGVEYKRVTWFERERVLVLFLSKDIICGAELFDGGIIQTSAFLHLGSDEKSLTFDLGHFWFDVSTTANGERICGDVAGVKT